MVYLSVYTSTFMVTFSIYYVSGGSIQHCVYVNSESSMVYVFLVHYILTCVFYRGMAFGTSSKLNKSLSFFLSSVVDGWMGGWVDDDG